MPGHSKCAVKYCSNSSTSIVFGLSFHRFPKDSRKDTWIKYCANVNDWVPNESSRICSQHFESSDYVVNEFGSKSRRRLTKNAIPTKNDWLQSIIDDECSPTSNVGTSQSLLKSVEELEPEQEVTLKNPFEDQERIIKQLKMCNNTLACQLSAERSKTIHLEKVIEKQNQQLSTCIVQSDLNQKIKDLLSGTLSSAQLDLILNLKKKVKWSKEDLSKAITLRYFSKRAYVFLQNEQFPLPSLRTIQLYCGKINLNSGILVDVLKFMNIGVASMQTKERAIVLLYDEMKVSSLYEYNKKSDEVVGPHNYVQVVMARSLFGNWKQPVYIGFDKNMNSTLLMEIIVALHGASFEVVAIVGDCGSSNQGTLNDLGVDIHKEYFQHPATEEKIFCFPDAPHLLKLIRNWLLRTGFQLSNGDLITKKLLEDLIRMADKCEISSLFKISERHLTCADNTDKQNVALACQLLSHSTATALKRYFSSKESEHLADFMQLVNDWFDIMNSRNLKEIITFKKPYESTKKQNEKLDEMYEMISTMRCIGKNNLQVFQKSLLISIKSLRGLFDNMQKKYHISYILTSKVNQDALENLFGILRMRGGLDDHPSPLNVIYRLRMVMLGKAPGMVHSNTNILPYEDEEITLTNNVLEKAGIEPSLPLDNEQEDDDMDIDTSSSHCSSYSGSGDNYIEKDGVEYLSGWLARKFNKAYPELGTYTYMIKHEDHSYAKPSWVQQLSYGGLTEPSSKLKRAIEILERKFKTINKGTFVIKKNILKKLLRVLKSRVDIPEIVTKAFLKQRIFIRMKKLNLKKKNEKKIREKNKGKSKTTSKLKKLM